MKLVYKGTNGDKVQIGDKITLSDGKEVEVVYFAPPHKPSSSGKVTVKHLNEENTMSEYFVGVIGAHWIEREDRDPTPYCHVCYASSESNCICPKPFYASNH